MRRSGILLPISSLPSAHGIGTLGHAAYNFVDFLAQAGQSLWQVLPTGPTGFGDSPYQSFSAFAGNPYFIDLDMLAGSGLLEKGEIGSGWGEDEAKVDYGLLHQKRFAVLEKAVARQNKADPAYRAFCADNAHWLDDYALFMAIKEAHGGGGFAAWHAPLRLRDPAALKGAAAQYAPRAEFWRCLQYFFFTQWAALKRYANGLGIGIVGDIPIYVSDDSSDLWSHPELFRLDEEGRPSVVAGVPPDAFSADGQLWGNPLYRWTEHRRTRYAWWLARLRQAARMFDITRVDHFRGFSDYYAVPAGSETAKPGRWVKGPGVHFIKAVHKALPDLELIAEDLGFLTEEVRQLLEHSRFPGMKVLQFAFDSREESDYLPHNYPRHCVVYTGTHDNTTSRAWAKQACKEDVDFARLYLGVGARQSLAPSFVRAAMRSIADTAIVPIWDWLDLDESARFNTPSTLSAKNWSWRLLPGQLTCELAAHIRQQTRIYGRLSHTEKQKAELARRLAQEAEYGEVLPREADMAAEKLVSMDASLDENPDLPMDE